MKRLVLLLMLFLVGGPAYGQDSSFSVLRLRGGLLRLPEIGHIGEDWTAATGAQVDVATNAGRSEVALGVGRIGFDPTTGKPRFKETLISLSWSLPVVSRSTFGLVGGARLTDIRMDFDDLSVVGGLRNEEEQLISALARFRMSLAWRFSGFVETSYGVLMTSTRTPTMSLVVGLQRDGTMPNWLRQFLR